MAQKIAHFIRKYDDFVVAIFLILIYFLVVLPFGYFRNLNSLMFSMPDAQSYRNVADWIVGAKVATSQLIIPVFYPLLLALTRAVANNYGIWGYQFLLWIISGILIYREIKYKTRNPFLMIAGIMLYAGNITLLLLTLHALTEITVVFLLTILIVVILHRPQLTDKYYWPLLLLIVSLLTITKPVFSALLAILLIYRIPFYIYTAVKRSLDWKQLIYFLLALLPVILQMSLMKIRFNEFTLSNIGPLTLKNYYLARVFGEVNLIPLDQARVSVSSYDQAAIIKYVISHLGVSIQVYLKTLLENFLSRSDYVNNPTPNIYLFVYMRLINILYFALHVEMIIPATIVLADLAKKRLWQDFEPILSLYLPLLVIFLSAGITFSQGDRIILPALPIWIVLYAIILSKYAMIRKQKKVQVPSV